MMRKISRTGITVSHISNLIIFGNFYQAAKKVIEGRILSALLLKKPVAVMPEFDKSTPQTSTLAAQMELKYEM